jgi:hypothetical protein
VLRIYENCPLAQKLNVVRNSPKAEDIQSGAAQSRGGIASQQQSSLWIELPDQWPDCLYEPPQSLSFTGIVAPKVKHRARVTPEDPPISVQIQTDSQHTVTTTPKLLLVHFGVCRRDSPNG